MEKRLLSIGLSDWIDYPDCPATAQAVSFVGLELRTSLGMPLILDPPRELLSIDPDVVSAIALVRQSPPGPSPDPAA